MRNGFRWIYGAAQLLQLEQHRQDTGDVIGLVDSLSRPGGNVTGLSLMSPDLAAKSLQMLKEAAPRVGKIGKRTSNGSDTIPEFLHLTTG